MIFTFSAFFLSAKLGQLLYFSAHTSPALIWPPVGVAFAAVLLAGYEMWLPIALAALLSGLTTPSPGGFEPLNLLSGVIGNTLQPLLGVYILRKIGFNPSLDKVRDVVAFVGLALLGTLLLPTLNAAIQLLLGTATADVMYAWGRLWAGAILSVLVFTPLITTWSTLPTMPSRSKKFEVALAFTCLIGINYLLFWTTLAQGVGFPILYGLIAVFIWMALRMEPRAITMALFLTTAVAVAGTIIAHPSVNSVGQQLLADELFIEFIAFIFLFLVAVVEERRSTNAVLQTHVDSLEVALETISSQDKAKNEFIAILAHELRNPLSPILSTLELLKLKKQDDESTTMLRGMEGHVHTMRRLLDDLLDIARVSQKKFELRREPTLLRPLVTHAVEMTQGLIDQRNHTLTVEIPPNKIWLSVDPVRFEQVVNNLLNNAAKYTPAHGKIELACSVHDHTLTLTVRDNGIGIEPERLNQIFEPFRQANGISSNGGLGLGLYLSRQLIEMHGGTIRADSAGVGSGSIFTIELPILTSVPNPRQESPYVSSLQNMEAYKILVVDDNEAAAQTLGKLLSHKGHDVTLAYTGTEALQSLKNFDAQVVVVDIGLPDIDGYEVARRIRQSPAQPLLIALTGFGQSEDKRKARDAGFDHHLTKPVGFSEVEDLLMSLSQVSV